MNDDTIKKERLLLRKQRGLAYSALIDIDKQHKSEIHEIGSNRDCGVCQDYLNCQVLIIKLTSILDGALSNELKTIREQHLFYFFVTTKDNEELLVASSSKYNAHKKYEQSIIRELSKTEEEELVLHSQNGRQQPLLMHKATKSIVIARRRMRSNQFVWVKEKK